MTSSDDQSKVNPYARALQEVTKRYERLVQALSILRQIDEIDDPEQDVEEICRRLVQSIAFGLASENCSLMLLSEDGEQLELRAACSPFEEEGKSFAPGMWKGRTFRIGEGIVGHVAETGESVRIEDASKDEHFAARKSAPVNVKSLMCFPLKVDKQLVGVLNLSHSEAGFFSLESENTMALIAERSARMLAAHLLHENLQKSEEHHRLVMEHAGDGILVFGTGGNVLDANRAIEDITGIPKERFIEGYSHWDSGVHPEDRKRYMSFRSELIKNQKGGTLEYRYRGAQGDIRYLEQRTTPLLGNGSEVKGFVCLVRDITDRMQRDVSSGPDVASPGTGISLTERVANELEVSLAGILHSADLALKEMSGNPAAEGYLSEIIDAAKEMWKSCRSLASRGAVRDTASESGAVEAGQAEVSAGARSVLLIEDDGLFIRFTTTLLESEQFRVICATDIREGIEQLRTHLSEIVAVIADKGLVAENGNTLMDIVREQERPLPLIMTYGHGEKAGPKDDLISVYLRKPFRPDDLLSILKKARQ